MSLPAYSRQTDLIDPELFNDLPILMIGAGDIGSWTALALTKMGVSSLMVVDHDTIEEGNTGSQLYGLGDIDQHKVTALANHIELFTEQEITPREYAYDDEYIVNYEPKIVILAVDSMGVRTEIAEHACDTERDVWVIDARMAGNEINLFCFKANDEEAYETYQKTLFSDDQAREIPCTSRAVVYNTFMVASLIANHVAHIARGETPPPSLIVDLLNYSLMH